MQKVRRSNCRKAGGASKAARFVLNPGLIKSEMKSCGEKHTNCMKLQGSDRGGEADARWCAYEMYIPETGWSVRGILMVDRHGQFSRCVT